MTIEKIERELSKSKMKLDDLLSYINDLESKKTEIENTQIVGIVRELKMTPAELRELLKNKKKEESDVEYTENNF